MSGRALFDVYGRLQVLAERDAAGRWTLSRVGSDGKRGRLTDLVVADGAPVEDVEVALEAAYHELAAPGSSIERVDG